MTFHDTIIDQSKYVCEQLSKIDEIAYFDFNIRISGTTNGEDSDGDTIKDFGAKIGAKFTF